MSLSFCSMSVSAIWWNSDYPAKYPMYVSDDYESTIPYPINLSTLYLNGTTTQVIWTIAPNESYLYENGESVYAVVNSAEDTQLNMTNESALVATFGNIWDAENSPEARYDLNNNFLDSTSNNHDGSNQGADYVAAGAIGGAMSFVASNTDWIDIGDLGDTQSTFSVCAWISSSLTVNFERVVEVDNSNYRFLGVKTDGTIISGYNDGSWKELFSTNTVTADTWAHVCLIDNGTATTLCVDGSCEGVAHTQSANMDSLIGRYTNGNYYDGDIDEVRVYFRALTLAEVIAMNNSKTMGTLGTKEEYSAADSCPCPGLATNWEIDPADYCIITTDCNISTGNLTHAANAGNTTYNATITTSGFAGPAHENHTIWIAPETLIQGYVV